MCGVAGVVGSRSAEPAQVAEMIACIRYRGVDEAGVEDLGHAILGHARLAVVDPKNGHQPMSNTDDSVWVVFNGEIYNYVELREELKAKGYVFKSRCDTEVLVHLWREEGEAMLQRLIGMFAFFIWDKTANTGILVRDRFGIKPMFIADHQGGTAFCSEIKGLLSLPGMRKEIDRDGLVQTFSFNYCPPPRTCFAGIRHLEPGTFLRFKPGKPTEQVRWWNWPLFDERREPGFDELKSLLDDAVRMQMRFDVEGGLYLSGGIDSSVVASHLRTQWNRPRLPAIGLRFKEQDYSEYDYSQQAASILGIDLEPADIEWSMIPEIADQVVRHAEQPHGDFSFFLFYVLARKANRQKKIVMFSGDGPDEALFGFNHNVNFFHANARTNFPLKAYFDTICYMDEGARARLLSPDLTRGTTDPLDRFGEIIEPWQDLDPVEQVIAYECTSLMPGNNLVKGDRMGAGWSTEGRSPFLDHRVMELFTRLPVGRKIQEGVGKAYLKAYAAKIFPEQFVYGKKRMPTTPIGNWLQGPLYGWAKSVIESETNGIFNRPAVSALLEEHRSGAANHTRSLRTILMAHLWLKAFFPA